MDLKEIVEFFQKNREKIGLLFLAGGLLGVFTFFVLPPKFVGLGSFFINRRVTPSEEFYTYSGYYDQQVALSYTNTVKGLLEGEILRAKALEDMGEEPTEKNLRSLANKIRVKDAGPQLIELQVKAETPEKTEEIWNALGSNLQEAFESLTRGGDENLYLKRVREEPVIKETYRELYIFALVGGLLTAGLGTFYFATISYVKGEDE